MFPISREPVALRTGRGFCALTAVPGSGSITPAPGFLNRLAQHLIVHRLLQEGHGALPERCLAGQSILHGQEPRIRDRVVYFFGHGRHIILLLGISAGVQRTPGPRPAPGQQQKKTNHKRKSVHLQHYNHFLDVGKNHRPEELALHAVLLSMSWRRRAHFLGFGEACPPLGPGPPRASASRGDDPFRPLLYIVENSQGGRLDALDILGHGIDRVAGVEENAGGGRPP